MNKPIYYKVRDKVGNVVRLDRLDESTMSRVHGKDGYGYVQCLGNFGEYDLPYFSERDVVVGDTGITFHPPVSDVSAGSW